MIELLQTFEIYNLDVRIITLDLMISPPPHPALTNAFIKIKRIQICISLGMKAKLVKRTVITRAVEPANF